MGQVTVSLNGRSYLLRCGDGEEGRLSELADYVGQRIDDLAMEFGQYGDERLLLMVTLMLADEAFDLRVRTAVLEAAQSATDPEADTPAALGPRHFESGKPEGGNSESKKSESKKPESDKTQSGKSDRDATRTAKREAAAAMADGPDDDLLATSTMFDAFEPLPLADPIGPGAEAAAMPRDAGSDLAAGTRPTPGDPSPCPSGMAPALGEDAQSPSPASGAPALLRRDATRRGALEARLAEARTGVKARATRKPDVA